MMRCYCHAIEMGRRTMKVHEMENVSDIITEKWRKKINMEDI